MAAAAAVAEPRTFAARHSARRPRVPTTSRADTAVASSWLAPVAAPVMSTTRLAGATAARVALHRRPGPAWMTPPPLADPARSAEGASAGPVEVAAAAQAQVDPAAAASAMAGAGPLDGSPVPTVVAAGVVTPVVAAGEPSRTCRPRAAEVAPLGAGVQASRSTTRRRARGQATV